jgi:hypothetical protein
LKCGDGTCGAISAAASPKRRTATGRPERASITFMRAIV